MTLSTHPEDRREMVRALSERLQTPAIYLRTPTYAFRIGKLTVNRDGSIASEALNHSGRKFSSCRRSKGSP